jgi:hypothetical protein
LRKDDLSYQDMTKFIYYFFIYPQLLSKFLDMKKLRLSTNFTVFLLFFGVAMLDAIRSQDWLKSIFWAGIGIAFLAADNLKKETKP